MQIQLVQYFYYLYLLIHIQNIITDKIKNYDEILLLGSGKGVTSVKTINEIKWKRKNLKKFKILLKHYNDVIKRCNSYNFLK